MRRAPLSAFLALLLPLVTAAALAQPTLPPAGGYQNFESGHVRPLAMSADGTRLFAVNTPNGTLEIFDITAEAPALLGSVPVGLEPVAVAARSNAEVWVVNHLSDSVSVVNVGIRPFRVTRTLLVGDEPRDIVFAGPGRQRAFITTAHRGQNTGFDPQSFVPGVGRADVWVFDAANLGTAPGGTPLTVLTLFGDTPRPLAVSPDGSTVYAGVFNSGNGTTVLGADIPGPGLQKPSPQTDAAGNRQPRTGLIVRWNGQNWQDNGDPTTGAAPGTWDSRVRFSLPDYDVFDIDAMANPVPVAGARRFSGVGTTLFNMAVNPVSGALYVSNQEARNEVRFEGEGTRSTTVRGHFVEARVTVIDSAGKVKPRHLNKHISSYSADSGTASERARALAMPLGMAVTANGKRLYLAAFGSQRVAWYDTAALASGNFTVRADRQYALSAGGPSAVVLDEARNRMYVSTRFDNGLSTLALDTGTELHHNRMRNPEPTAVRVGRKWLYDARISSSRGDSSCGGCHIFGDMDHLAWDLGNPDEVLTGSPNTYNKVVPLGLTKPTFHPMKGPMATQSLRGLAGQGPMHWRGDRTGLTATAEETLEEQSFEDFKGTFTALLGRSAPLTDAQMNEFAKFAMTLVYPPNPHRALDNSLNADEQAGSDFYHDVTSDIIATCNGCHVLNENAGFFGTDGTMSIEGPTFDEDFKIPHLRNLYQKVGMFGSTGNPANGQAATGPQIRGFGFSNDGAVDTLVSFLRAAVFSFPSSTVREQTAKFMMAFPSNVAPITGQQLTVSPASPRSAAARSRLDLLRARASVVGVRPECELVAAGVLNGRRFSALLNSTGSFTRADAAGTLVGFDTLYNAADSAGSSITWTCVPPGSGLRIGIDRNLDGIPDAQG